MYPNASFATKMDLHRRDDDTRRLLGAQGHKPITPEQGAEVTCERSCCASSSDCLRLRRGMPGLECRDSVSASAVVVLPESVRRSSRSLRSIFDVRRQERHGDASVWRE
jgi:hypothetical protein